MRVAAGQLRIDKVAVEGTDAGLSAASTLDLTDGTMDSRLTLIGQGTAAGARPEIFVSLKGPSNAPTRSVDVSALTAGSHCGLLTIRRGDCARLKTRRYSNARGRCRRTRASRRLPCRLQLISGRRPRRETRAGRRPQSARRTECIKRGVLWTLARLAWHTVFFAIVHSVVVENEKTNRGRQISMAAIRIDRSHEI